MVLVGVATAALFAYVAICRFVYPIDAEWMVGSVREAVDRLAHGQPMYVEPTDGFIPYVYPPLYHWTAAIFARFMSVFVACKVVSLLSTAALGWSIWTVSRKLGATRFWAFAGILLHISAFSATLMFYDLERVDAFAAAVVALALTALVTGEDRARTIIGAVLLGLAFFAKQPHVLALGAACAALFIAGQRKRAFTVAAIGGAVLVGLFAYLEVSTHGWFRYYCVTLPGAHGLDPKVISTFFVVDWPKLFVITAASFALGVPLVTSVVRTRKIPEGWSWELALVAAVVVTTMIEAFSLRAHRGGWANVIIAWTPFGCLAAAVVAARLEARATSTSVPYLLLAGFGLQLLGGTFDPNEYAPDSEDLAERQRFIGTVRELEKRGDVVVTTTGGITKNQHYQMAALFDVIRSNLPLPASIADGFRERRYAAVIVGAPHEFKCEVKACEDAFVVFASNYFVAARRADREHTGMTGFDARPRWIMLPRKHPLKGMTLDALDYRLLVECGLAVANTLRLQKREEPTIDETIEERAAVR